MKFHKTYRTWSTVGSLQPAFRKIKMQHGQAPRSSTPTRADWPCEADRWGVRAPWRIQRPGLAARVAHCATARIRKSPPMGSTERAWRAGLDPVHPVANPKWQLRLIIPGRSSPVAVLALPSGLCGLANLLLGHARSHPQGFFNLCKLFGAWGGLSLL